MNKWNYKPLNNELLKKRDELAKEIGIPPVLCQLLVQRGIMTAEDAKKFFRPRLEDLYDPFLMKDMKKAVNRLNQAMGRKEKIWVYGDYDVDGTTAVALVYKFLQQFYSNLEYYIPNRYSEGYGISYTAIDSAIEKGISLIIILDCGIKAVEKVAYAKEKGIDFIICDHHMPDNVLPEAVAVLDPKREDSVYPYVHLCGCGVGFKFMQAFAINNGIPNSRLYHLLDLVAVSIASDIVPITGENRILAHCGLRQINNNPNVGLKGIIDVCGLNNKEISINDIIFKIGPRINASGRMQSGNEAVDLLITRDVQYAKEKSEHIDKYNQERKDIDKDITIEANILLEQLGDIENRKSIVVYNKDWHKGVIGIVASRLTEEYCRPAVVLTQSNGLATGSARSVLGFDIYKGIESCRDLLENFGGHTYAAGLSMKEENISEFSRRFENYVRDNILPEQMVAQIEIDAEIDFKEINYKLCKILKQFNPFGPENLKPLFCTRRVYDYGTSRAVGKDLEHLKLEMVDNKSDAIVNGIAFGMSDKLAYIKKGKPFDICYTVEENSYNGASSVQLMIQDIHLCE